MRDISCVNFYKHKYLYRQCQCPKSRIEKCFIPIEPKLGHQTFNQEFVGLNLHQKWTIFQ